QVAASILFSINRQLSEADLSDFVAGRPEAEVLEVMTIFSEPPLKHSDLRYLNLSNNALDEKGVRAFGQLLASQGNLEELYLMNDGCRGKKPGFKLLNINGNFLSDEGVDNVKQIFKNFPSVLGLMDENDPEGEDYDDEEEEDDRDDTEDELESKLKDLEIKQDE
nr:Ran GTPase-activating protein 1 [Tanacetum cinerariifolium]